jgi:hypothetical protein
MLRTVTNARRRIATDALHIKFPRSVSVTTHVSYGAEARPHVTKVLFRALLTQLHPGRSGTPQGALNRRGHPSTAGL